MNIFIKPELNKSEKTVLKQNTGDTNLIFAGEREEEVKEQFRKAEVAFGNVPADWLQQNPNLRWLQLESVGFDDYRQLDLQKFGNQITITNLKGLFGVPVAETALAGILSFYRGIDRLALSKEHNQWIGAKLRPKLNTLHNKKVLILGGGSIGSTIQTLLEAFSCEVVIFGRTASSGDLYTTAELDDKLPIFDIVISCLPETSETKGLFTAHRLGRVKSTALFVNVGRGSVVNEQALAEALQHNRLGGAVLDVTQQEPLPKNHPLWDSPNTVITQHTGGGSKDELHNKVNIFLENLERYKLGKELTNIVNFERGY